MTEESHDSSDHAVVIEHVLQYMYGNLNVNKIYAMVME